MLVFAVFAVTVGCAEPIPPGSLQLEILTPPGEDPLGGVAFVRLRVDGGAEQTWPVEPGVPIDVGFHAEADSKLHQLFLEGLDADEVVVSKGTSPPVRFEPGGDIFMRVVARPVGRFSLTRNSLLRARVDFAMALSGDAVWVIGGQVGGETTAATERIDAWLTEVEPGPELPAPRQGHVALTVDERVLVVGDGEDVLALDGDAWRVVGHGPDERHLAVTDGPSGPVVVGAESWWMLNWDGEAATLEHGGAIAPRGKPVAVPLGDHVFVFGGGAQLGEVIGLGLVWGAPVQGGAAISTGDAALVLAGDRVLRVTAQRDVSEVALLAAPRAFGTLDRLADGRVIAIGGAEAAAGTAELLFEQDDGSWLLGATIALNAARMRHLSVVLPGGNVMVVGGVGPSGGFVTPGDVFVP